MRRIRRKAAALLAVVMLAGGMGQGMDSYAEGTEGLESSTEAALESPVQPGWNLQGEDWYYYRSDKTPGSGWIKDKGSDYYLTDQGRCLTDCVTPDGYYVDGSGRWYPRSQTIWEISFQAPERFPSLEDKWRGSDALVVLRERLSQVFKKRALSVTENYVEYASGSGKEKKVLLGLYKEPERDRYRLELRTGLDSSIDDQKAAATYDYMVFQAMLYQITSTPDLLEEAVYGGWQGENPWNIRRNQWTVAGDCQVMYVSDTGCGYFYVRRAEAGALE